MQMAEARGLPEINPSPGIKKRRASPEKTPDKKRISEGAVADLPTAAFLRISLPWRKSAL
jgi:hypothetical protein